MSIAVEPSPAPPSTERHGSTLVRVALAGCGAVAKSTHLPILAGHNRLSLTTLVDRDEARAGDLARAYNVPRVLGDINALGNDVDAVVLATPPAHHAPATIALAERGIHVFVEKPMAPTLTDAEAMVAAADRAGISLGVGLYRRKLPAVRLLKQMISSGEFGAPLAVDVEEGGPYGWQLATLSLLTREGGGGGVLIDIGSHLIDLLLFVLPGNAECIAYEDNNRGGIETDCVARFMVVTSQGPVPVRLELSRTRELRGSVRIECEHATLELLRGDFTRVVIHRHASGTAAAASRVKYTAEADGAAAFIGYDAFRAQIDDWLAGIMEGRDPELSGRSVIPVVRLIEECYQRRVSVREPWSDVTTASGGHSPAITTTGNARRLVLVTGAGGFLGCRTVDLLANQYGYDVVAMVKEPRSAARLALWPREIVLGDVCSAPDMDRALRGCDAVVHCAVGTSWDPREVARVTVQGTQTVVDAAQRAGIKRFVHISTMNVHEHRLSGVLDENVPLSPPPGESYGRNKLAAEKAVRAAMGRGLSSVILRPARIYGPFSKTFTVRPLQALTEGRLAISGDPNVPANMVYVDNVVAAIVRALDATTQDAYLINDADQVSLREFFDYFGRPSGRSVRLAERPRGAHAPRGLVSRWIAGGRTVALSPEVRALVHRVMDTPPIGAVPTWLWNASPALQQRLLRLFKVDAAVIYRPKPQGAVDLLYYYGDASLVTSEKARRELGFAAAVSSELAMALTLQWAEYARLVPSAAEAGGAA